jgi:hypothetical protein
LSKKEGVNISFVLTQEQVDANLNIFTDNGQILDLYRGKKRLASICVDKEALGGQGDVIGCIRDIVDQYKNSAPLLTVELKGEGDAIS